VVRKTVLYGLLVVLGLTTTSLAQEKAHAISFNPLNLIGGGVSGNYEYIIDQKHGILVDGCSDFSDSYSVQVAYLRHCEKDGRSGHWSPFWGPYVRYRAVGLEFEDDNVDYTMDFKSLNIGLMMGKGYQWGDNWKFQWRAGYGAPVYTDHEWDSDNHSDRDSIETMSTILGGIEVGVSLGYVF
jgi:hypothetical protein